MARRKNSSTLEDFVDVVALLPWWAAVALAILSYFVLHSLATPVAAASFQPGRMGDAIAQAMWKPFAYAGQIVVPIACLIAAVISAVRQRRRKGLVEQVSQSKAPDALDGMTWREFEMLVGESFRLQGYQVTETGGNGADGGIDLIARKGGEKFLVQCKQWRAFKVGVQVVRELYGVMAAAGAAGGFVVTSGRLTEEAREWAKWRNVTLIDGAKLFGLIQQAKASLGSKSQPSAAPIQPQPSVVPSTIQSDAPPHCPTCLREMVLRTAKRGANAGGSFWGCTGYPGCRGTRQVA